MTDPNHFLFLVASTREPGHVGNTEWLARQAAASLPADTPQTWVHLARAGIPEFVDQRHTVGSYPMPDDGSVMRGLLDQTLACTDLVFVAPVYWFSFPSTLKAYLDHWSAWLRVPGLDFKAQMSQKRLWLITTNGDRAKAQPMIDSTAMCAKFLDMPLAGVLWGKGGAPEAVKGDVGAVEKARVFLSQSGEAACGVNLSTRNDVDRSENSESTKFKLFRVRGIPVTDEQFLDDLKRVALQVGSGTVSQPQYSAHGRYDMRNLSRRLGGWKSALSAAGLAPSPYQGEYSDESLFANILVLWQHLGRQPRRSELAFPPSDISQSPYQRRFGSWSGALEAFVKWANVADAPSPEPEVQGGTPRRTSRDPSLRLRFQVLMRDRFTCCGCGKSPATSLGTVLHVDHIVPWSKGGETVISNLKTMCLQCNIGKSNVL